MTEETLREAVARAMHAQFESAWDDLDLDDQEFALGQADAAIATMFERLQRKVMDELWPALGGNHQEAELWEDISSEVRQAMLTAFQKENRDG